MSRPLRHVLVLAGAVAAATLAGCGTSSDHALRTTLAALDTPAPRAATGSPSITVRCTDLTASLRPPGSMPAPGAMPSGSYMAAIQRRGYLIAGVNAGLLDFGYLNPANGQIEGFEIDLVKQLARAIFGSDSPSHYRLVALTVPQRLPFVQEGRVDVVVDAITITCQRKQQVDFSTVYYDAKQRVLVPSNSNATGIGAFVGQRVCASAQSAPITVIQQHGATPVGAPQAIDCLVDMQEGRVEAISTDDSILLGFKAQDPNTKLVGPSLADVPYGMAISRAHPDFVRFANGVLARLRAGDARQRLSDRWHLVPTDTLPPAHYDG